METNLKSIEIYTSQFYQYLYAGGHLKNRYYYFEIISRKIMMLSRT